MELVKKKFVDVEIGSVFRDEAGKTWQKVTTSTARDLQPPPPQTFELNKEVELLYDHGDAS